MKLRIHSHTLAVALQKFENGKVISAHTFLCMKLLFHAGLMPIHVNKRGPCNPGYGHTSSPVHTPGLI